MNIGLWLSQTARLHGNRPAVFLGKDQVLDYTELDLAARRLARFLIARDIQAGDRIAIFMKNCPDYLICMHAIWYAGAVAVPINAKLHAREARFVLENSGAPIVFASADLSEGLAQSGVSCEILALGSKGYMAALGAAPLDQITPRAPSDVAWLFYTSGTTGKPKGVMITHRMLVSMSLCYQTDVELVQARDAVLYAAPMSHGAGLYAMMHVLKGARHVCPVSGGFDASEVFDLARYFGDVQMFAAPTMVKRMTDAARRTAETGEGIKTIVYAGGPMYLADIIDAVDHFGPKFMQIYGQGECPMAITTLPRQFVSDRNHPRWQERLASVGYAQSCVEVQIGDANGHAVPVGEQGEIMVRGDTVMPGYWQDAQATERTIKNGWLMTGDIGHMDADGFVTLQDRSKDVIISGGSNIYPREVEEVLLRADHVSEVSVVGHFHPEWGEEVVAFVVGTAEPAALDKICQDNIARFKRPKTYIFVPELPKNNYGKVLKTELRRRLDQTPGEAKD